MRCLLWYLLLLRVGLAMHGVFLTCVVFRLMRVLGWTCFFRMFRLDSRRSMCGCLNVSIDIYTICLVMIMFMFFLKRHVVFCVIVMMGGHLLNLFYVSAHVIFVNIMFVIFIWVIIMLVFFILMIMIFSLYVIVM